jgi:hypothetical protein
MTMVEIVDQLVMVETRKIKPYHRNPRTNDATVDKLVELIPKVGFNVPLVLIPSRELLHPVVSEAVELDRLRVGVGVDAWDLRHPELDRRLPAGVALDDDVLAVEQLLGGELASLNLNFAFDLGTLNFELADNRRRPPSQTVEGDKPFISEDDVRSTASLPVNEYHEVTCNKCGNKMFVKKDGTRRQEGGQQGP